MLKKIYRQAILELKEAGIDSAELDARVLICYGLNISLEKFFLIQNEPLSPSQIKKINLSIKKRTQNMPVAYILGQKEFFGLDFEVDKNVLIPRPETEWIVEKSIKFIICISKFRKLSKIIIKLKVCKVKIMDMGTGCGNIIIAIAKKAKGNFYASDISPAALAVAKKNAASHHVDKKIKFIRSDLFDNIKNLKFDIIIANLPYVPENDKNEPTIQHEPTDAIFAPDNGAEIIKRFLKSAPRYLSGDNSMILLELDPRNAEDIKKYATVYFPQNKIRLEKDLAGLYRYLIIA